MLQLTGNLCVPHKAFHKLQLIVLVGLDFCNAHAGVRRRRRCDLSETPPPIHLATADKPVNFTDFIFTDAKASSVQVMSMIIMSDNVLTSGVSIST